MKKLIESVEAATFAIQAAAESEIISFLKSIKKRCHNHTFVFDDGMGQKSITIYRHDGKYIATVIGGDIFEAEFPNGVRYYSNYRGIRDSSIILEIANFLEELDYLTYKGTGYIGLERIKV